MSSVTDPQTSSTDSVRQRTLELGTTSGVGSSFDLAFNADSSRAYVAALTGVYVIDTSTHAISTIIPFFSGTDGSPRAVAVLGANPISPTPSNLRVTAIDGNRVSLAWNQPASGPATSYVIEGGLTAGSVIGSVPTGSAATSFTFDAPTGVFYFRVHAITSSGRSPASTRFRSLLTCRGAVAAHEFARPGQRREPRT